MNEDANEPDRESIPFPLSLTTTHGSSDDDRARKECLRAGGGTRVGSVYTSAADVA